MKHKLFYALILLLPGAGVTPSAAAEFSGSLVMTGQGNGADTPAGNTSLEFSLLAGSASLNGRFSGAYQKDPPAGGPAFVLTDGALDFRSPRLDIALGDISPQFSDYTLSSPSNEEGAELNLKAAGFSFRPVYLQVSKADEARSVYARRLYGASVVKDEFLSGLSLGAGAYRAADDLGSLKDKTLKKPSKTDTLGVKAEFKRGEGFNAFSEAAYSAADDDVSDSTKAATGSAFKGGLGLNWDNWNIAARYSRCGKDFRAAGVDAVDSDQGKFSADLAYSFSQYINARVSESRITDGISKGENQKIYKQNSLFSLGFSLPGLPSLGLDYSASRNTNKLFIVNDETEDFGYNLNYVFTRLLPGLTALASGRLSNARDHTLKTNPARTLSCNLGLNIPGAVLVPFNLTPNYSYTKNTDLRTRSKTFYDTFSLAVSVSALSGKVMLNAAGSRSRNFDNRRTIHNETRAFNSELAISPAESVKIAVGGAASVTTDAINPAGANSTRQYTVSTTIMF